MNYKHGMSKTKEYKTWQDMITRCTNPNFPKYKHYGGRGIFVSPCWMKFENFYKDMGNKPKGMTLERIDNNKNYIPGNCRWATWIEQNRNQRLQKRNKTGIPGVDWHKPAKKYHARIWATKRAISLGLFAKLEDAVAARKAGEQKYWGKEG